MDIFGGMEFTSGYFLAVNFAKENVAIKILKNLYFWCNCPAFSEMVEHALFLVIMFLSVFGLRVRILHMT